MNEQETIADIIAEMRALSNPISDGIIAIDGRGIADRLEAAHKRESGDRAKLREALEYMFILIDGRHLVLECETTEEISGVQGKLSEARAALAAPPRNCDRFATKFDAKHEWERVCKEGLPEQGPFADWLLAPATEKEGGATDAEHTNEITQEEN